MDIAETKVYAEAGEDIVAITCYGETKNWRRSEAEAFFLQGMLECEGSEQARYANIYSQLVSGEKFCFDEM